jgi:hypothetical protein
MVSGRWASQLSALLFGTIQIENNSIYQIWILDIEAVFKKIVFLCTGNSRTAYINILKQFKGKFVLKYSDCPPWRNSWMGLSWSGLFHCDFPIKILYAYLIFPTRVIFGYFILLDIINPDNTLLCPFFLLMPCFCATFHFKDIIKHHS